MNFTTIQRIVIALMLIVACSTLHAQPATPTDTVQSQEPATLIGQVVQWYSHNMNYATITALMTVESSFIPFPSEVVIPPAAYVAAGEGSSLNVTPYYWLNIIIVILFGTLGAIIGAIINYLLALWLGRPIIYAFADSRVGHLLLLSSDKISKAEEYFNEHGNVSTLVGRFIPGIRQLISIPAGLAKMNFISFIGFTALGAMLWNTVLALLGYIAQGQSDLINRYSHELSVALIAVTIVVIAILVVRHFIKKRTT